MNSLDRKKSLDKIAFLEGWGWWNLISSLVRMIKEVKSAKPLSGPGVVMCDKRRGSCLKEGGRESRELGMKPSSISYCLHLAVFSKANQLHKSILFVAPAV